ncbi:hypothetical protein MK852_17105 [Shewanella benthica]|uniref:hypothetical protein n=1 Tax=Shewanella benthica TaxID=43661 RepID=UPI00187A434D|nr:hypothetical protein [Shewanella benthica]MBE7213944.1 hypothetical protein [Shewanella benthica]MCL1063833.1 hypothetical protein [Shewanella benthica]
MTRVILHIGTEKTGTTSIQHFLSENRQQLLKHGVLYPHIGPRSDAHFDLVNALHPLDNNGRRMEFLPPVTHDDDYYWNALSACIEDNRDKTIILSAEHFSSRLKNNALGYIRDFFDKLDIKPEILIYLRPQEEYIESSYSTAIKSGSHQTFEQVMKQYQRQPHRYNYSILLALWGDFFGQEKICVFPYQKEVIGKDIRLHFMTFLGIHAIDDFLLPNKILNKKWDCSTLELARMLNHPNLGLNKQQRELLLNRFRPLLAELNIATKKTSLMTTEEVMVVRDFFKDSNALVAKKYLTEHKELFTLPVIKNDSKLLPPALTKLDLVKLLAAVGLSDEVK